MENWSPMGGIPTEHAGMCPIGGQKWAGQTCPRWGAAVAKFPDNPEENAEDDALSVHDGGWVSHTLPMSPETLSSLIAKAPKRTNKISFPFVFNSVPTLPQVPQAVGKEGPDGKLAPITSRDMFTLVLPWLVESGPEPTEKIKQQFEQVHKTLLQ
ncbi:hypothetical protein QBC45DRAFT_74840 [Copromyces sp. CBS 386.78]|nr:hypothetical protein QBC45DRAFT_74840 [Copromyces sp. CBS 386.78]